MAKEPSATPSTLEALAQEIERYALSTPHLTRSLAGSWARRLRAALRPSEGPETGRPPADEPPSQIFAAAKMERRVEEAIGDVLSRYSCAEIRDDVTAAVLAALPAGPETGDRERLRALALDGARSAHLHYFRIGFEDIFRTVELRDGHNVQDFDTCSHPNCVLVRQAAPAASEGQK